MNHADIIAALDSEIQRLQEARAAIAGLSSPKRRGRPPASTRPTGTTKRRGISAAGRRRIAEAQRKRWAAQKTAKGSAAQDETGVAARKAVAKRDPKKAAKTAIKKITVKRVPPKERVERRPRSPKEAPASTALSSRSETVAVPAASARKA